MISWDELEWGIARWRARNKIAAVPTTTTTATPVYARPPRTRSASFERRRFARADGPPPLPATRGAAAGRR